MRNFLKLAVSHLKTRFSVASTTDHVLQRVALAVSKTRLLSDFNVKEATGYIKVRLKHGDAPSHIEKDLIRAEFVAAERTEEGRIYKDYERSSKDILAELDRNLAEAKALYEREQNVCLDYVVALS